jgi:hypothetical protein
MLKEELTDIDKKRAELDDIISDLYELKPLLEQCENNAVIQGYKECEAMSFALTEWYIRTKPLFKDFVCWLNMYFEQKVEISGKTEDLRHKIKTLRHSVLSSFNKS